MSVGPCLCGDPACGNCFPGNGWRYRPRVLPTQFKVELWTLLNSLPPETAGSPRMDAVVAIERLIASWPDDWCGECGDRLDGDSYCERCATAADEGTEDICSFEPAGEE